MPQLVRGEYNKQGSFCSSTRPFSRRRGSIRALCIHLHQTMCLFQLSCAARTFFAMDETANDLPSARHTRRSDQRKIRTPCGKRSVAAPTNYSPATNKTPHLPEDGPTSSGTPSQDGSDLETGTLPCSARDDPDARIVSSSVCSGSTNPKGVRRNQDSRPRRSP